MEASQDFRYIMRVVAPLSSLMLPPTYNVLDPKIPRVGPG